MDGDAEPVNTVDGDAEPVERLRKKAKNARNALRQAQSLQRKLDNNEIKWDSLGQQERESLEQLASRKLHVNVDKANQAYGHGIARTNDFGFEEGENMCRYKEHQTPGLSRRCSWMNLWGMLVYVTSVRPTKSKWSIRSIKSVRAVS